MDALTAHWQGLYDVEGCGGLEEGAPSAGELVQGLMADSGPLDGEEADTLSAPVAVGELVAAVRKLKYGRMMWPLRGEFLKGCMWRPRYLTLPYRTGLSCMSMTPPLALCWEICAPC